MALQELLEGLFAGVGVTLKPVEGGSHSFVFARLEGDCIKPDGAWLKADDEVCNISMPVGPFPLNDESVDLAVSLLKVNFKHPYGRVSIAELESKKFYVVCETMIAIRDVDSATTNELQRRLLNLTLIRSAATALVEEHS